MEYSALIVAAGSGSRMNLGYNKMLFKLQNGHTIIEKTVDIFRQDADCKQIVVVTSSEEIMTFTKLLGYEKIVYAKGGETRAHSVMNGLYACCNEYVLIHDGARPWLSNECLNNLKATLVTSKACILGMPVKDTIKVVENGIIQKTPKRSTLYLAQTPQAFLTDEILTAYQQGFKQGIEVSDDASMMEACGKRQVVIVEGSYANTKVTTIEDIQGK